MKIIQNNFKAIHNTPTETLIVSCDNCKSKFEATIEDWEHNDKWGSALNCPVCRHIIFKTYAKTKRIQPKKWYDVVKSI
jgi:ssDNA-binding Zn-finger/Zn-ribbon topoisomerase 1